MPALPPLARRDDTDPSTPFSPAVAILLTVLLSLVLLGLACAAALLLLRNIRNRRTAAACPAALPALTPPGGMRQKASHRRLTVTAAPFGRHSPPISVVDEKTSFLAGRRGGGGGGGGSGEPDSPVPEIRITFPDEAAEGETKEGGRVVVVRIGEGGAVGLEPCRDEPAPPYSPREQGAPRQGDFRSLDLERIGGLREGGSAKQWA